MRIRDGRNGAAVAAACMQGSGGHFVSGRVSALVVLTALCCPSAWAIGPYTITDLGTLGGTWSRANGINNAGQVVGCATSVATDFSGWEGGPHAFLYSDGVMTDLGTLQGDSREVGSCAHAINGQGQIAGQSQVPFGDHAFLYSDGVMTDLGTLGGSFSKPKDLNDAGQVVGVATRGDQSDRAFLYSEGSMTDLGTAEGFLSAAFAINNSGQVVGGGWGLTSVPPLPHAFLYQHRVLTDLGTLGGSTSNASDINDAGQIVGSAQLPGDAVEHAFIYENGVMTDLSPVIGENNRVKRITNTGMMLISGPGEGGQTEQSFLYKKGVVVNLLNLLPPDSGWSRLQAEAINDSGQIVGQGFFENHSRAFLMTPASLCAPDGVQASGSIYRICMPAPADFNGDLVIWAHGFQDAGTPVQIPEDQLSVGEVSLPEIVNGLGFAFATNSYSKTGLAVQQGMADILDLVNLYTAQHGAPRRVYLTGASEGGLITTLLVERHPEVFTGGVAACGPIGSFEYQINYFGDARVLFEVFFPGVIPGDPFAPPQTLVDNWQTFYEQQVRPVVFDPANRAKLRQWVTTARLPFDANNFVATVEVSVADVLRYAVVNAADAEMTLGGFPFDNRSRLYTGSNNDLALNRAVSRLRVDAAARTEMRRHYDTRGQLAVPLVTLHTQRDQQVPQVHQALYTLKTLGTGDFLAKHIPLTVNRFEHCNFTAPEMLVSFGLLVQAAGGSTQAAAIAAQLPLAERPRFHAFAQEHGLK